VSEQVGPYIRLQLMPFRLRNLFTSTWLTLGLSLVVVFLLIANLAVIYSDNVLNNHQSFAWRFYFDKRQNFPFYFSVSLQLLNLFLIYRLMKHSSMNLQQVRFWTYLFIAFLIFTIDEAFYLHFRFKMMTFGTIASYDQASLSHYLWVIPYFVIFGFLMIMIFRYSSSIRTSIIVRIVIAAILFLTGAVVLEFVGTYYAVVKGKGDVVLQLIKTAESLCQMTGMIVFIHTFASLFEKLNSPRQTLSDAA
jgi:hypothetical protein